MSQANEAAAADSGSEKYAAFFAAPPSIEELAAQQGVQPASSLDDLAGEFWPESDSVDEFIATVRTWRREGRGGPSHA